MPSKGDALSRAILDKCERLDKFLADAPGAPGWFKFSNRPGEIKVAAERQPGEARMRLANLERELLEADDGEGKGHAVVNPERNKRLFPDEH